MGTKNATQSKNAEYFARVTKLIKTDCAVFERPVMRDHAIFRTRRYNYRSRPIANLVDGVEGWHAALALLGTDIPHTTEELTLLNL